MSTGTLTLDLTAGRVALLAVLLAAVFASAGCAEHPVMQPTASEQSHRRILKLDSHLDSAVHFARPGWSFGERHSVANEIAQLDLPRMEGNLDGGFFAIFVPQGPLTAQGYAAARSMALERSTQIDDMVTRFHERIGAGRSADDALTQKAGGKLVAFKSMENSYPLGDNLGLLAEFARQGVRLAGPVHSQNNQFADSATDTPRWNGLSPLGRDWVREMNRLGIVIDASHASDAVFDQMLALSRAPLLLSHSGPRAAFDHPRNLDDARLRKLAAAGGAICMSTIYLSPVNMNPERAALFQQNESIARLDPAAQAVHVAHWNALNASAPLWSTTFAQYMAALRHTIEVAGIDHVCFGADFDGGGGIEGIEDVTALPRITAALKAAGYSDADLEKLWSGNILRILRAAAAMAAPAAG